MSAPNAQSALLSRPGSHSVPQDFLHELTANSSATILAATQELLLEYGRFVASHPSVASFCFGTLEQEAAKLPQSYLDRGGGAIVAFSHSRPVGFVAWRSLAAPELASSWELKRLWIRPEARGSGIGRSLIQAVLDRARANGKSAILLDTAPDVMAAAHRLYLQFGFVECPPYSGPSLNGIIYMRKSL
ncbi:GNAT family N-acetyltransferase [Acidicapsa acidisoli]|uniref:GNAT family N-acetyltransferase n=1 Tax=Acidicapsa acidisoli TaxID=1615681 RepID=UPI0021E0B24C|nr:GNAT family N-acetyltransferase [Acidicapsa acidisoli]